MNSPNTSKPVKSDFIQRFVFDQIDARGCFVRLQQTCEAIQATHHYPASLAKVLNQFALAVSLLRDSIKIEGSVTIQLRSPGAITLIMADSMADRRVRAIAEYDVLTLPANEDIKFSELGDGAMLAITITPDEGERYQGIVPIEHDTLEQCLEDYFARSEQLPTWFCLRADGEQGVGISIHALPGQTGVDPNLDQDEFQRLKLLLQTLQVEEALQLDAEQILTRLFHADSCRLFESNSVAFGCQCSAQKSLDAIKSLGEKDIAALIAEQQAQGKGNLVVDCHFCFQRYEFGLDELNSLLS